jgi:small subunit ribosomal protein S16
MVKIRLRRVGAKKQPHYRVVVADSRSPRDGKFIEIIGHYNPRTEPPTVQIDDQRALYWLSVGAQPTAAVHRMLDKLGIMARFEAHKLGGLPTPEVDVEPEEGALAEVAEPDQAEEEADLVEPEEDALWAYSEEDESDHEDDLEYDEDDLEYDEDQEEDDLEEEEE